MTSLILKIDTSLVAIDKKSEKQKQFQVSVTHPNPQITFPQKLNPAPLLSRCQGLLKMVEQSNYVIKVLLINFVI